MAGMVSHDVSSAFHAEMPRELAAAVAGLGPPLGMYRTSPAMTVRRVWWGGFILLIGLAANVWFWAFAPQRDVLIFLAIIGIPLAGLTLWLALLRDRGIWVMRFPMGLLRWQRGEVMSLPWDDVAGVSLHGVARCGKFAGAGDGAGGPARAWIPLDPVANRVLGPVLRLYREDGLVADFPASLTEFPALSREIQEQVFRYRWPAVWREFQAGGRVRLGVFTARNDGLHFAGSRLRWGLAEDAMVAGGQLQIRAKGLWKPWADAPLDRVFNPHILLALFLVADDIAAPRREARDV